MKKRTELSVLALLLSFALLLSGCSMMKQAPGSILKEHSKEVPVTLTQEEASEAEPAAAQPLAEEPDVLEDADMPEDLEEPGTAPQENVIEDKTRPEPEKVDTNSVSKAGVFEDNVYRNDYFGFQITLDDAWIDNSLQEYNEPLLAAQGATAGQTPDEIIDNMEVDNSLYTLGRVSYEKPAVVQVMVSRVGVKGTALTTIDETIEFGMQMMSEQLPDAEISRESVTIGTSTLPAVYVANVIRDADSEVPIYMEMLLVMNEDYMAAIYLVTYYENNLENLLSCVSIL